MLDTPKSKTDVGVTSQEPRLINLGDFDVQIANLNTEQLDVLYDTLRCAADALAGGFNLPVCRDEEHNFKAAGRVLNGMFNDLMDMADFVVETAKTSKADGGYFADARSSLLIKHEVYCGSSMATIAALSASLAVENKRKH